MYILAQHPVRYALVRGAGGGKKFVLLSGKTNLSVSGYERSLQVS